MCIAFMVNGHYCRGVDELEKVIGADAIVFDAEAEAHFGRSFFFTTPHCLCIVDHRRTFPNKLWRKRRFDGCDLSFRRRKAPQ